MSPVRAAAQSGLHLHRLRTTAVLFVDNVRCDTYKKTHTHSHVQNWLLTPCSVSQASCDFVTSLRGQNAYDEIPCNFPASSLVDHQSPVFMRVWRGKFFFAGIFPLQNSLRREFASRDFEKARLGAGDRAFFVRSFVTSELDRPNQKPRPASLIR